MAGFPDGHRHTARVHPGTYHRAAESSAGLSARTIKKWGIADTLCNPPKISKRPILTS